MRSASARRFASVATALGRIASHYPLYSGRDNRRIQDLVLDGVEHGGVSDFDADFDVVWAHRLAALVIPAACIELLLPGAMFAGLTMTWPNRPRERSRDMPAPARVRCLADL